MKQYNKRLSPKKKRKKIVSSLIMPLTKVVRINSALVYSIFFLSIFRRVVERGKEKKTKAKIPLKQYNDERQIIKLFEKAIN
jgi:hypothetical protein